MRPSLRRFGSHLKPGDASVQAVYLLCTARFSATERLPFPRTRWKANRFGASRGTRTCIRRSARLPAEVALAREDFKDMASIAEAQMTGCEFVVDPTLTVADFVLAYTLDMANEARVLDPFT